MWNNCIVISCPNASGAGPKVSMFYLPADKYSASMWLQRVGRLDLHRPSGNSYKYLHQVCSRHFSRRQFNLHASFKKPKLLPNALPDQALPSKPDLSGFSMWPTPIAPRPLPAKTAGAALIIVNPDMSAPPAEGPMVHMPVECELGDGTEGTDTEDGQSPESSVDAAGGKEGSTSQMFQLKVDTIGSLQEIQPGVSSSDAAAKKVVRLHLPPGISAQEFAASETFQNITSKLPALVHSNSSNKPIFLKVPLPPTGADKSSSADPLVTPAAASPPSTAAAAATPTATTPANDSTSGGLSANISGGGAATKIQLVRVKASDVLCGGVSSSSFAASPAPSSALRRSHRRPVHASRYGEFCEYSEADDEEMEDPDDPDDAEASGTRRSVKKDLADADLWRGKINILKRKTMDRGCIDLPDPLGQEPDQSTAKPGHSSQSPGSLDGRQDPVSDKRAYYRFMHDLNAKRRQRNTLVEKVRRQKELLIKRSNELHRYRVQLHKMREKSSRRRKMTTTECMKVLNGNMREHALELLYTQLMAAKNGPSLRNPPGASDARELSSPPEDLMAEVERTVGASGGSGESGVGGGGGGGGGGGDGVSDEDLVYTPKVLEAALLFSVAGKKAYKAMTQSLKLPSYAEIVKWKKIIRSNPPFYKKHFPHIKAKFFKKKPPEERGKRRFSEAGSSNHGDADMEMDGWQSEYEDSHKPGEPRNFKKSESKPLSPEEADRMYKKLIEAEKQFQALLAENDSPNQTCEVGEEDAMQELIPDEEEIDYDLDASTFVKKLKEREKRLLYGDTWDYRLAQLSDHDDPSDSEAHNLRSQSDSEQTTVELTSVNEAIDRVISNVVKKGPSDNLKGKDTRTLSITANSDGSPEVVHDDRDGVTDAVLDQSQNHNKEAFAETEGIEAADNRQCRDNFESNVNEGFQNAPVENTTASNSAVGFSAILEPSTGTSVSSVSDTSSRCSPAPNREATLKTPKKVTFSVPIDGSVGGQLAGQFLDESVPAVSVENTAIKGISFKILDASTKSFSDPPAGAVPPLHAEGTASISTHAAPGVHEPEPSMPQIF